MRISRARALALLTLLALVCLPAAGAAAKRTVPAGFLGVVADRAATDGTVPLGAQMKRMRHDGAETVGLSFGWVHAQPYPTMDAVPAAARAHFQPTGPASVPTDFRAFDRRVLAAARAGLRVHAVLIAAPPWARLDPSQEFSPPADPGTYANFAAAMVHRYGPQGSLWRAHPHVRPVPIRDWQVWNEPVGGDGDATPSVFWVDSQPFQSRYIALLRAAHGAIAAADPGARVGLGALVGQSWRTLQLIYDAGGAGTFDVVALHPYTTKPSNVVRIVRNVRQVMTRNGDGAKPIQVTELGWPAFDAASVRSLGLRQSSATQAWWLQKTFKGLIAARSRLNIGMLLWYTWIGRDRSGRDAFDYSGLLHLGAHDKLTAKPALKAFYSIARRVQGR